MESLAETLRDEDFVVLLSKERFNSYHAMPDSWYVGPDGIAFGNSRSYSGRYLQLPRVAFLAIRAAYAAFAGTTYGMDDDVEDLPHLHLGNDLYLRPYRGEPERLVFGVGDDPGTECSLDIAAFDRLVTESDRAPRAR